MIAVFHWRKIGKATIELKDVRIADRHEEEQSRKLAALSISTTMPAGVSSASFRGGCFRLAAHFTASTFPVVVWTL